MEKLEKTLEKIPVKRSEVKSNYKGLQLIEDRRYEGGTGVKYWM